MGGERDEHLRGLHLFAAPEIRRRFEALLTSEKKRDVLTHLLAHKFLAEPRCVVHVPKGPGEVQATYRELIRRGGGDQCYVVSEYSEIDDTISVFNEDLLRHIIGSGMGNLLSIVPGRLAYFNGEDRNARYIIDTSER